MKIQKTNKIENVTNNQIIPSPNSKCQYTEVIILKGECSVSPITYTNSNEQNISGETTTLSAGDIGLMNLPRDAIQISSVVGNTDIEIRVYDN